MAADNTSMPSLRVGTFNANGLGNPKKRDLVLNWLKSKREDIIFLQETHTTASTEKVWSRSWEGEIIFNHGTSNTTGVAILFKPNIANLKIIKHKTIIQGRATLVEIEINNVKFCLVNVYCPNNDDTNFLESVFLETLGRSRDDHIIMAGDWNTVLDNTVDKCGGLQTHANHNCQDFINSMITDYGLSDIFRLTRSTDRLYTHFNKQHKTATRLDFFLVDDNLVNFPVCYSDISHGFSSDHSYVSLIVQGTSIQHGRGYWKFNNSHLLNNNFVNSVKQIITDTSNESFDSYSGLWDVIKFKIKDLSIRHGKHIKKQKSLEKDILLKRIDRIKKEPNFMNDNTLRTDLFDAEVKLNDIILQETKGAITRSRVQWTEEGERSTKYFFSLEKSNGKKKAITKLIDTDNNVLTDQTDIFNHV